MKKHHYMKFLVPIFTFLFVLQACTSTEETSSEPTAKDEVFKAVFHTTQGDFTVAFHPAWAPIGTAHARELIESGFYTDIAIFRFVPDYVVQFGISNDSSLNNYWIERQIKDEPVLQPNKQWTVSYARDGADTRDTQLFINLKDNTPRLDTINYLGGIGFPVIGEIVEGTEIVSKFYREYGNTPAMEQDSIYDQGNAYLKRKYPELDYILSAEIIKE
jgi:cyclophilin family peptidyl-prolyl cis-trans isomerase